MYLLTMNALSLPPRCPEFKDLLHNQHMINIASSEHQEALTKGHEFHNFGSGFHAHPFHASVYHMPKSKDHLNKGN